MGDKRELPDWNFPNDKAHTDPLPDSSVPVPVDNSLPAEVDLTTYWEGESAEADPLVGMSAEQLNLAATAAQMILETCPVSEEWFSEQFDSLSPGAQRKIYSVLAAFPHLRGEDLVVQIEDKLTLEETVEVKRWASYLPAEVRNWLLRG